MQGTRMPRCGAPVVALLVLSASIGGLAGCAAATTAASEETPMTVTVSSPAFEEGGTVPDEFTCRGEGGFPDIAWSGDAGDIAAIAVVVDDPDAPGGTFTHLVVLDLPASTTALSEPFPADAVLARNSADGEGWTPPCPPSGTHHYRFTVYGLSAPTGLDASASPADALAAITALEVASGTLTGLVAS